MLIQILTSSSVLDTHFILFFPNLFLIVLAVHVPSALGDKLPPNTNYRLANSGAFLKNYTSGFETSYSERSKTSFNFLCLKPGTKGGRSLPPPQFG